MRSFETLTDLLDDDGPAASDSNAMVFLDSRGRLKSEISVKMLKTRSDRLADVLAETGVRPGDVALMAISDQARFVTCFFALMRTGAIPAPIPPLPTRRNHVGFGRVLRTLREDDVRCLVLESNALETTKQLLQEAGLSDVLVLSIEDLMMARAVSEPDNHPYPAPSDIAYIQYTSGSTARPKGIALTHENVLANLRFMDAVFDRSAPVRLVSWLPLHHDMGLVGHLLTVLYTRGFGAFMTPNTFLRDPALWLDAIHTYRANSAATPNFALRLCADRVAPQQHWDLSCWTQIFIGAETVSLEDLDAFAKTFSPCGLAPNALRPVYGLAEAGLLAAGGRAGLTDLRDHVLYKETGSSTKRALLPYTIETGISVTIRDPETGDFCAEGDEGEIHLSGDSLAQTSSTGPLLTDNGELPTGDLGRVSSGRIYISGRYKDVVIVRGRNFPAEDLEQCLASHLADVLDGMATVAVSEHGTKEEDLYIFQEMHRHSSAADVAQTKKRIAACLIENFGMAPHTILCVPKGKLPRTTSAKLMRRACLTQFLEGSLPQLGSHNRLNPADTSQDAARAAPARSNVRDEDDPIVIVGMACRFPGADTLDQFWQNLCQGVDSITEVPKTRWDNDLCYDPRPGIPGKSNTKWAGFIDEIESFDADLFGLSAIEARETDPQHRLLLETSWRLLENTGTRKSDLAGTNTGVYVGISNSDYLHAKITLSPNISSYNAYTGLGNAGSIAANRLSYFYDLHGPSMSVDTACSSSLTAFHLAVQALRLGECDQAIVGGVNAILSPGSTIVLSQFGMMSPEGRCKVFDASADGYVRAEGCGLVMIKRRSAAIANGDRILADIKASAAAQDGAGSQHAAGITFPNGAAQNSLIARALRQGGLSGDQISYVETHGTGTASGDPIEVAQLNTHYGRHADDADSVCWLGAVKANIGHLESAAGIAGLIKAVLVLQNQQIPPQIHVNTLNPAIDLSAGRLAVPNQLEDWAPHGDKPRLAAISSFGFGGALAHVILSQPDDNGRDMPDHPPMHGYQYYPLALSAPTRDSLKANMAATSAWLHGAPGIPLADISYSFAKGRSDQKHRVCVNALQGPDAADQLDKLLALDTWDSAATKSHQPCFLFSGQGELYHQMGKELYQRYSVFRREFDRCAAVLNPLEPGLNLADVAFSDADHHISHDRHSLPILFAVQHALTVLFETVGITPAIVLGHSMGEFAAASAAGVLSPTDAMWLLYHRSKLMEGLEVPGCMLVVNAPADEVQDRLDPERGQIAAFNAGGKVTISGDINHIMAVQQELEADGTETHPLNTRFGFHSPIVEPILEDYRLLLEQVTFHAPNRPWVSSVTADYVADAPSVNHWLDHLRHPVQYAQALETMRSEHLDFVEIGPGGSCLALALANLRKRDAKYLRTLLFTRKFRQEDSFFIEAMTTFYQRGLDVDWSTIYEGHFYPERLPPQVFDRSRHWIKAINAEAFARHQAHYQGSTTTPMPQSAEGADTALVPSETPPVPKKTTDDWHYTLDWTKLTTDPDTGGFKDRRFNWVVVGPDASLLASLCKTIDGRGDSCFWIEYGTPQRQQAQSYPKLGARIKMPDAPTQQDWHEAVWDIYHMRRTAENMPWKIVFVSHNARVQEGDLAALNAQQTRDFTGLIWFLHALKEQVVISPIWLVTNNTQAVPIAKRTPDLTAAGAPLWGFGKTLYLEQPDTRGGMIDVDLCDDPTASARLIVHKVINPEFEPFVALRDQSFYAQQLKPDPLKLERSDRLRCDGAYIVTGGLAGLGFATAKWLAAKGANHLVLLSRRALPPEASWTDIASDDAWHPIIDGIKEMRATGVTVETRQLDVRDAPAVQALFQSFDDSDVPIRGVVHAAGENWFDLVENVDVRRLLSTLKTKVQASWQLHELTKDRDLDCFVLFSTVSSLWGSAKLSHYTAANHFLDCLAEVRREQGLPVTNVNWGPWDEVGMSAAPSEKPTLQKLGFELMPVADATAALETAMAADRATSMICAVDWQSYSHVIKFAPQPSFFAHVHQSEDRPVRSDSDRLTALRDVEPDVALDIIQRVIRKELQAVTLLDTADEISGDMRFNILGMDSLMALTFAANLENYFQCEFPTTVAYNYPTINALCEFIFDVVQGGDGSGDAPRPLVIDGQVNHSAPPAQIAAEPLAPASWLRPLNAPVPDCPTLVCLPFAGSGAFAYQNLANALDGTRHVVAVQIPGREDMGHMAPVQDIHALVDQIARDLVTVDSDYILFGHSMGAVLAYELTIKLTHTDGRSPRLVVLSGANRPRPNGATRTTHLLDDDAFVTEIMEAYGDTDDYDERRIVVEKLKDVLRADLTLFATYQPSDVAMTPPVCVLYGQEDTLVTPDRVEAWAELSQNAFQCTRVDGDHQVLLTNPAMVAQAIDRAERMLLAEKESLT
ncbi:type I polyketide synthase [uncultured Tateyamaria sp.]|uniref:type I polyketide synthase n=1 Tax=uncultured Tateyamaria sp. TaxID=455651 RepID=UPI0026131074|nr:type I polyketide synthase [uncultured Tateyamaria sp.]